MEKKGQSKKDKHYLDLQSVVTLVKQLPQAGDSQKRKETESNENLNAKRMRKQNNHVERPHPNCVPVARPPPPYLLHHMPPPPNPRVPKSIRHHFGFVESYPDPGDDGWRMWR